MEPFGLIVAALALLVTATTPLQPAAARPSPPDAAASTDPARVLAGHRARWTAALYAAGWDRDAATARAAADALLPELLPLLAQERPLNEQAYELLFEMSPDALGATLRAPPWDADPILLRLYLRRHDDPAAETRLQALARQEPRPQGAEYRPLELASIRRPDRVEWLIERTGALTGYELSSYCTRALDLPPAARARAATALVRRWAPARAPDALSEGCVILGALVPTGVARLAAWLRDTAAVRRSRETGAQWPMVAALMLAEGRHAALARATLAPVIAPDEDDANASAVSQVALARMLPLLVSHGSHLPLNTPLGRALCAQLAHTIASISMPDLELIVAALRLAQGDLTVAQEALDDLAAERPVTPRASLALAGITGGHGAGESARVAEVLRAYNVARARRGEERSYDPRPLPSPIPWITAIAQVDACNGARACLLGLVHQGAPATAARAVFALGATGMGSLTADEAQPLLMRLMLAPASALTTAVAMTVQGCPRALRGLREVPTEDRVMTLFQRRMELACDATR